MRVPRSGARPSARRAAGRGRRGHRSPGVDHARVRQPRAGHRALRPARLVPQGARRGDGPRLPGVHHRRARGRRGGRAGPSRRPGRDLRRHAARAGHGEVAGRRARPRARRSRSSTASMQALELARATTDEMVFFATGFETTAVATAAVLVGDLAEELLGALGAQVHPAGDGDRHRDAGHAHRGLPRRRATPPSSPARASSRPSCATTGCRSSSPASSRSTSSRRWSSWSSWCATARPQVVNMYPRCVTREGNLVAQAQLWKVFRATGGRWRGIAHVPSGNLRLRDEYAHVDARRRFTIDVAVALGHRAAGAARAVHLRRDHVGQQEPQRLRALRQGMPAREPGRRVHGVVGGHLPDLAPVRWPPRPAGASRGPRDSSRAIASSLKRTAPAVARCGG